MMGKELFFFPIHFLERKKGTYNTSLSWIWNYVLFSSYFLSCLTMVFLMNMFKEVRVFLNLWANLKLEGLSALIFMHTNLTIKFSIILPLHNLRNDIAISMLGRKIAWQIFSHFSNFESNWAISSLINAYVPGCTCKAP